MAADIDALNYPYIRVRDADWLKRTLLIFPHVVRMTPFERAPADDPEIDVFNHIEGRRGPLLRPADLHAGHVYSAQRELVAELRMRLEKDGEEFLRRFGRQAARRKEASNIAGNLTVWERRMSPTATFQIHAWKLFEELTAFLTDHNLAWRPRSGMADGPEYLEMHPQLGEAVMATLAMACAENEGLQVVTEFPTLHGKLLGTPRGQILTACIDGRRSSGRTSGRQIAELLVYRRCNVDMLGAENIAALADERAALADFRGKLELLAENLPAVMHGEKLVEQRIDDLLNDMFREWRRDQANLGPVGRRFFGEGVISESGKLAQSLIEAAIKPEIAGDAAKGAMVGGITGLPAGNLTMPVAVGAGAGFVVAVLVRGIESWRKGRETARNSPLRYLTSLQNQGVSFSLGR